VIFVQFVAKSQVMFKDKIIHKELSYKIVGLAMQVHTELGFGFLEKVYENSLMILLRENGIKAEQQVPIKVYFQGQIVGEYVADILVEDSIILELKAQTHILDKHKVQTLNYLKATNLKLGILLNFGKQKLEYERLVL
jgi:GxxExxY protein